MTTPFKRPAKIPKRSAISPRTNIQQQLVAWLQHRVQPPAGNPNIDSNPPPQPPKNAPTSSSSWWPGSSTVSTILVAARWLSARLPPPPPPRPPRPPRPARLSKGPQGAPPPAMRSERRSPGGVWGCESETTAALKRMPNAAWRTVRPTSEELALRVACEGGVGRKGAG
eukprot:365369-Chlamydomonas_euryale.AAC.9